MRGRKPAAAEARQVAALVRRTLGLDVDLSIFLKAARALWREAAAQRPPAGASARGHPTAADPPPLLRLLAGARPPRFTSLFEAILGVVPFQQISLDAGMTVFARLVETYGPALDVGGVLYRAAPLPAGIAAAPVGDLRALGFSATKVRALQNAAAAILEGSLREDEIEALPTPLARKRLLALHGIGPWSADLILLRGFGRLDAFPPGDVGVARGLAGKLGDAASPEELALRFAPQQGMLYFSSLVLQLAARGLVHL
jgi:DNA-3-methyladenine glycosylase II